MSAITDLAKKYQIPVADIQIVSDYQKTSVLDASLPIILDTSSIDVVITDTEEACYHQLQSTYQVAEINTRLVEIFQTRKKTKTNIEYVKNIYDVSREEAIKLIASGEDSTLDALAIYLRDHGEIYNHRFSVSTQTLHLIHKYKSTYRQCMASKIQQLVIKSADLATDKPVRVMDIDIHYYYIWLRTVQAYGFDVQTTLVNIASKIGIVEPTNVYQFISQYLIHGNIQLAGILKQTCRHDIWLSFIQIVKGNADWESWVYDLAIAKLQYYASKPADGTSIYPFVLGVFVMENISYSMAIKKLAMIHKIYYRPSITETPFIKSLTPDLYEECLVIEKLLLD